MNSDEIEVHGIGSHWLPLNHETKDETLSVLPKDIGVYLIRASEPICRAKGESDIAYIGKAKRGFGLYGRVQRHITESSTTDTSGRVRQWLDWRDDLQLGYIVVSEEAEADKLEIGLLERYEADHYELPPINRRMG